MSIIADHWRRLSGNIHPDDAPLFATHPGHTFNLDFPPPAFIGNIDAPIIILMSNGGYRKGVTESEFPDGVEIEAYRSYLRGERKELPLTLSQYYTRGHVGALVRRGTAVWVNAIPYRSPHLSEEPANKELAHLLPSLDVHRRWLVEEALPAARIGKRHIFVHRNALWGVPKSETSDHIVFSDASRAEPNRRTPDAWKLKWAEEWLATAQLK